MVEIILGIALRWVHIIAATAFIGGLFFLRFLLPPALQSIDDPAVREMVFLKCRRAYKITVHSAITLLLISGLYNTWRNWSIYSRDPALNHPIWGMHLLLALAAFSIALYGLAGKKPPANQRKLATITFVILLAAVAAASTLKWAREKTMAHPTAVLAATDMEQGN